MSEQLLVTVRADAKKCAAGGFEIDGQLLTGRCEQLGGLVPPHQRELRDLGRELQSALATGVVVTPTG